ncbi:hypothetical protein cypCar_00050400, partial [Cyprinus carpio]
SAFNNNVRVAYELLTQGVPRRLGVGGVRGRLYSEMLRCLCSEGGLSGSTAAPLLRRIQSHDYESVPFELFRQGVLTCAALETADGADVARYLEASAKISPAKVAQAMAEVQPRAQRHDGLTMDAQEFEDAAAALFIARVRTVS